MDSQLDATDLQILNLLQYDARLTNKEIADKIGKTPTPVFQRKRKLEEEGVILKYMAIIDRHKINRSLIAYTNVKLKEHAFSMLKSFEKQVVKFDEVTECQHMTGMYDYLLKIAVKDMNEYQQFIVEKLSKVANIETVQSSFVMTEIKAGMGYPLKSK